MIACLRIGEWPVEPGAEEALVTVVASRVPRLAVEREAGVVWADLGGLPAREYAAELQEAAAGAVAGIGVAMVPVVARAAAWCSERGEEAAPVVVESGAEATFLAELPLEVLGPDERLRVMLEGVGIERCGALAVLDREPVEVRFGAEGVRLRELARAEDGRRLFGVVERERPNGCIDFVDYVVTDPARLLFAVNALLGPLCDALHSRGEHARRLTLRLELANGGAWRRTFRAARPTASRDRWLRLVRGALERLTVADAVAGVVVEAEVVEPAAVEQGDLFDRGFATAGAVEAAVARLLEAQGAVALEPEPSRHPLPERRTRWRARDPSTLVTASSARITSAPAGLMLTLQLLPEPQPVGVRTSRERGREVPCGYRIGARSVALVRAAGPDRISGGHWEEPYAREYYRCVTEEGVLVWLYRDARLDRWFLHGWWD